jgi:uncharacterized protein YjbI with pentapeptide repeats
MIANNGDATIMPSSSVVKPEVFSTKTWNNYRKEAQLNSLINDETSFAGQNLNSYFVSNQAIGISGEIKSNFSSLTMTNVNFSKTKLKKALFTNSVLININFYDADLSGVDFSGAILRNVNFIGANLVGAVFDASELYNVKFTGAVNG